MTRTTDWLPHKREAQIAFSENWQTILTTAKASAWSIPTAEVTALRNLTTVAEAVLALAQSAAHTVVITAQAKVAFAALTEKMRFFKNRYFAIMPQRWIVERAFA
jgi:flagellar hook-length control protein FliK